MVNPTQTPDQLDDRIHALEREIALARRRSSRDRLLLVSLAITLGATVTIAARPAPDDVIQAARMEIVDDEGHLVLAIGADDRGGRVDLWSKGGANVLRLSSNEHGGDFNVWSSEGITHFSAFATPDGGSLGLWDRNGVRRFEAAADGDIGARLDLLSADGKATLRARSGAEGGALEVNDGNGQASVIASATGAGGVVRTHNADGTAIFALAPAGLEGATMTIADGAGRPRVAVGSDPKGGAINFFNERDEVALIAGVAAPGGGGIVDVRNDQGTRVVAVAANKDACGRLELANPDGQSVFTLDGVVNVGAIAAWYSASGRKSLLAGSRREGGIMNVFNQNEVPIVLAGYSDRSLGGALSIKNSRGLPVVHLSVEEDDAGSINVYDAEGDRARTVKVAR